MTAPGGQWWRTAALSFAILTILANLYWVSLPFSFYGLRGRSGVLYGEYTLFETFYFHPVGQVWWVLLGLQVFAAVVALANVRGLKPVVRLLIFGVPAVGLLLLDLYIALRWSTLVFWSMYALGVVSGLLSVGAGACYAKSH